MPRLMLAPLLLLATLPAAEIEAFGRKWTVPIAEDWTVEGSGPDQVLRMLQERPSTQPRRPSQFALAPDGPFESFTLEAEVRPVTPPNNASLIIVYAWRDAGHFNYVHLSPDLATKQPVHNGIFHVYGGDRVRISPEPGPPSLPPDWTPVKVVWSGKTGLVRAWSGGRELPTLRAVDLSLTRGKVGLGSFFNRAEFRKVRITGR